MSRNSGLVVPSLLSNTLDCDCCREQRRIVPNKSTREQSGHARHSPCVSFFLSFSISLSSSNSLVMQRSVVFSTSAAGPEQTRFCPRGERRKHGSRSHPRLLHHQARAFNSTSQPLLRAREAESKRLLSHQRGFVSFRHNDWNISVLQKRRLQKQLG